jgi:hypothetical protein
VNTDNFWRIAILTTSPVVIVAVGLCALLAWPVLPLARQWMWIAAVELVLAISFQAANNLYGWDSPWGLPLIWAGIAAMGIGFTLQVRENARAWRLRRDLTRQR